MSDLKYYRDENERHPLLHCTTCSTDEAKEATRRLWRHFAKAKRVRRWDEKLREVRLVRDKSLEPDVRFTSGNRLSNYKQYSGRITLNTNRAYLNWLTVIHEAAHAIDHLREKQGRRSSEARWHSKYHAALVDRLAAYVVELGWHTGNLAHELALRQDRGIERAKSAARGPSLEERIAHREEQVARLEKKIRALTTRSKTAKRSLAALRRSKAKLEESDG